MGVVYSSKELATGMTPATSSHQEAAEKALTGVSAVDGVQLTVVHGSVVEGRSTIRSDLDMLVTYVAEDLSQEPAIVSTVQQVIETVQAQTYVRVEPNIWPSDEPLAARYHRMYDRFFAHHLGQAMRRDGWAQGEPDMLIDMIVAEEITEGMRRELILNYLTYKHGGITKAPRKYGEASPAAQFALQRVLEFPKSFGRKLLQMQGDTVPDKSVNPLEVFRASEVPEEVVVLIEKLAAIDKEYTDLLEFSSLYRVPNEKIVAQYLGWLEDRYIAAMATGIVAISGFTRHVAAG